MKNNLDSVYVNNYINSNLLNDKVDYMLILFIWITCTLYIFDVFNANIFKFLLSTFIAIKAFFYLNNRSLKKLYTSKFNENISDNK